MRKILNALMVVGCLALTGVAFYYANAYGNQKVMACVSHPSPECNTLPHE